MGLLWAYRAHVLHSIYSMIALRVATFEHEEEQGIANLAWCFAQLKVQVSLYTRALRLRQAPVMNVLADAVVEFTLQGLANAWISS